VNFDYASDIDDRKSTIGYAFTLAGGSDCWKSIIQSLGAISTTEMEYMAVAKASKEVVWLQG